jgi:hypothetical protein
MSQGCITPWQQSGAKHNRRYNHEDTMKTVIKTVATILIIGLSASFAQAEVLCKDVTAKKPVEEAKAAAVKAGYADITKMDEEDGCYEAKGLNADGSKFEVYIHPTTLEIVKVKKED